MIVTRGHRYDQVCLEHIFEKKYAYVGMMGSRKRVAALKESILEKEFPREKVEELHSPIGLAIRAETPEEIAVSIMAEIIEVKNKTGREESISFPREKVEELHSPIGLAIRAETPEEIAVSIMAEIIEVKNKTGREESISSEMLKVLSEKEKQDKILATIVSRRGSAPRKVGTKMVIFPDGKTMGTIGGGCMEAEVISHALMMLRTGDRNTQIYSVDMTNESAEDEGMVCGGIIDVMLEGVFSE